MEVLLLVNKVDPEKKQFRALQAVLIVNVS